MAKIGFGYQESRSGICHISKDLKLNKTGKDITLH